MKKAILFDLDGTLTDTSRDICDNVNLTLRNFGYPEISLQEAIRFTGNGALRLIESSLKGQNPDNFKQILDFYNNAYNFCGSPKTCVYDGMKEVLKNLKKDGYLLAIISNKPQDGTNEVCKKFFPDIKFDYVFGQREGINVKPSRDCVDFTLKELGVSVSDALFVGDSDVDAMTAINAEIDSICVLWGFRTKEDLIKVGAKNFARTAGELYSMIKAF